VTVGDNDAMSVTDRLRALFASPAPGYPFGTLQVWIGLALVLFVAAVGESIGRDGGEQADDLLPTVLGTTAPVAFANRAPRAAAVICVVAMVAQHSDSNNPRLVASVVALGLVLCAAGFHLSVTWAGFLVVPFVFNAVSPFNGDDPGAGSFLLFVVASGALGIGLLLRSRGAAVEERDASVAAHTATLREQSLLAERTRIARELHDVVAHHISAIAIQAETARFTTPELPELGAERFEAIGDSARAALDEMRGLLGVMRAPVDAAGRAPQPGFDQLTALIDEHRTLGGELRFSVRGPVAQLSDAAGLVAYRVVEEALTNARRHAPRAPVEVSLDYTPTLLRIAVRDHGPGLGPATGGDEAATGFGLIGMRERVEALGGTFTCGDHAEGGFEIVVDLPVDGGS
jgi:signal transduction histidine kinase